MFLKLFRTHVNMRSMRNRILLYALILGLSSMVFSQNNTINYTKEITERPYPKWFKDAKLGIFIHWGLYSVPSYGGKESYGEQLWPTFHL